MAITVPIVGFYLWKNSKTVNDIASPAPELSIAVLPFKSNDTPEALLLANGLTEQVHTSLASLANLKVISKIPPNCIVIQKTPPKSPRTSRRLYFRRNRDPNRRASQCKCRTRHGFRRQSGLGPKVHEGKTQETITFINKAAKEISNELNQKLTQTLALNSNQVPTNHLEAYQE